MPTLRDALLPVFQNARGLIDTLGLRQFTVTVRTRTWASGEVRVGQVYTDSDLTISPDPKVKESDDGQTIVVGPITPQFTTGGGGGYTPSQLNPAGVAGVEFYWLVAGPFASGVTSAPYVPVHIDTSKPFRYMITCKSLGRKMPF